MIKSKKTKAIGKNLGVDYFPHEVRMCDDEAIQILESRFGLMGYATWLKLLELIYSQGYYAGFGKKAKALFLKNRLGGLKEKELDEILECCFDEELLDRDIYEAYQVLTSYSIQKRYVKIVQKRDVIPCCKEFWLYFFEGESFVANKRSQSALRAIKNKMVFVSFSGNEVNPENFDNADSSQKSNISDAEHSFLEAEHPFSDAELQKMEESKSKSKRESKSESKRESKSESKSEIKSKIKSKKISPPERERAGARGGDVNFFNNNFLEEGTQNLPVLPGVQEVSAYLTHNFGLSRADADNESAKYVANRKNNASRFFPGRDDLWCNVKGLWINNWQTDVEEWLLRDVKLIKGKENGTRSGEAAGESASIIF